jgi:hypothetical protein
MIKKKDKNEYCKSYSSGIVREGAWFLQEGVQTVAPFSTFRKGFKKLLFDKSKIHKTK